MCLITRHIRTAALSRISPPADVTQIKRLRISECPSRPDALRGRETEAYPLGG